MAPWVPIYLVLLLAATLSPCVAHCTPAAPDFDPGAIDFCVNTLFFLPLGWALRRWRLAFVALVALGISGGVELAQRWLLRTPSPWDVAANVVGALVGARLLVLLLPDPWPRWSRRQVTAMAAVATVALIAFAKQTTFSVRPNDFRTWAPYPLLIGNEMEAERPWRGQLRDVRVFDRPITPTDLGRLRSAPWEQGGPVLAIDLASTPRAWTDGPAGRQPVSLDPLPDKATTSAGGVHLNGARWQLPPSAASHVFQRARGTHRIAVAARLRLDPDPLPHPGRILTLSWDAEQRNFTLDQAGHRLGWRVRTPTAGANGENPVVFTTPIDTEEELDVVASFTGPWSRIWINGTCTGERLVAARRQRDLLGQAIALTIVTTTAMGALLGALLLGIPGTLTSGTATWSLLWLLGAWNHYPDYDPIATILGAVTVAAVVPGANRLSRFGTQD